MRPRTSSVRSWLAASALVLTVVAVLSNLGGAVGAWTCFVSWLKRQFELTPDNPLVRFQLWLFPLAVLLLAILVAILLWVVKRSTAEEGPGTAATASDPVRERYLRYLHADVENRLRSSIHGARFLDLRLLEAPGAAVPWHYVYRDPGSDKEVFGFFDQAFERFERRLLLLGSPGSGKTTTLLHAAQRLIAEAQRDPRAPVPVLLNLASFGAPEEPRSGVPWLPGLRPRSRAPEERAFEPWLIEQLARLPVRGLAAATARWLEEGQIALLLDGLDEVEERWAERLLRALNTPFLHRYADLPTVVSSRVLEYQRLATDGEMRLRLNGAVTLKPLDHDQIRAYLATAGATVLRDALEHDRDLYELAQTPLILSLMTLVYGGPTPEALPAHLPLIERRRHLFDTYVERMLQRAARRAAGKPFDLDPAADETPPYSLDAVNRYLGWLAVRLSERKQTSFMAGDLISLLDQETVAGVEKFWTEQRVARLFFVCLLSAAVSALFAALVPLGQFAWLAALAGTVSYLGSSGMIWLLSRGEKGSVRAVQRTRRALLLALALLLFLAYFSLFFVPAVRQLVPRGLSWLSLSTAALIVIGLHRVWHRARPKERWAIGRRTIAGLVVGLVGLAVLRPGPVRPAEWLLLTAFVCLYGSFAGRSVQTNEAGTERASPSGRIALEATALILSLLFFLLILGVVAGVGGLGDRWLGPSTPAWTVMAVLVWIGLSGEAVGSGNLEAALGAVSGLLLRGPAGAAVGVFLFSYGGRFVAPTRRWTIRLFLQPLLITVLAARGRAPWRLAGFVSFSSEALLLRKVGEAYEFVHRLLRDHFALRELLPLLYGAEHSVRVAAVQRIAARGESGLQVLDELAEHSDPAVIQAMVAALGALPLPWGALLLGKLVIRKADPTAYVQLVRYLAELPGHEMDDFLWETLKSEAAPILPELVAVLVASGQRGAKFLRTAMDDPDPIVAQEARRMYGVFLKAQDSKPHP